MRHMPYPGRARDLMPLLSTVYFSQNARASLACMGTTQMNPMSHASLFLSSVVRDLAMYSLCCDFYSFVSVKLGCLLYKMLRITF